MTQNTSVQLGDTVTLTVAYKHTVYEDNDFRILNTEATYDKAKFPFSCEDEKIDIMIKGRFAAPNYRQQGLTVTGEWKYDRKNKGYFIAVEYLIPALPCTPKAVELFSRSVEGIGPRISVRIAKEFPNGFLLEDGTSPNVARFISSVKGLTTAKATSLCTAIRRINVMRELTNLLKGSVSGQIVRDIAAYYGENAFDVTVSSPYRVFYDKVASFKDADAIAIMIGRDLTDKERLRAGVIDQVRKSRVRHNAIIAEKDAVLKNAQQLLGVDNALVTDAFQGMFDDGTLVSTNPYCYTQEDFSTERTLAGKITEYVLAAKKIQEKDVNTYLGKFAEWKSENQNICLAKDQEVAVKAAANNYLSVLTGGPGTGKTTVLKAVMETYQKAFPKGQITLMAPTGLAAKRMAAACGFPARTIHKTLGLVPSGCDAGFDDSNGLSIDGGLVVVDEFSMVGIHLAKFLFDAVLFKPDMRIVLVGDIDQLPPVSPGAVLDDLIQCQQVTVTRLNRNFRQEAGSPIVDAAYAINKGETKLVFGGDFRMRRVEYPDTEKETTEILETIKRAFAWSMSEFGLDQTFVLSPKRRVKPKKDGKDCVDTMLSTMNLNPILRDIANPAAANKAYFRAGQRVFREGDRVINLKNSEDVLNGEIGYIEKIEKGDVPSIRVKFPEVAVTYTPDRLRELDLAYAITVHKAQGCEYDSVIYPTSMTHGSMMQRNLLYTAVTRAKKSAVIIGSRTSLGQSIKTVRSRARQDLLAVRINKYVNVAKNR